MPLIMPFAGLRPKPEAASEIAAPPYDVLSLGEARAMAAGRPASFLHISRAEIDLPDGTDPYSPEVYAKAREHLDRLRATKVLVQDPSPRFYAYRIKSGGHQQTGLVAAAAVQAYQDGRIRRHELTRPTKEQDRVNQIRALEAQTGPVFLAYRAEAGIDAQLAALCNGAALLDVVARDGVRHQVWPIDDVQAVSDLQAAIEALGRLYIADGHHRAAAAARVAEATPAPSAAQGATPAPGFLAVLFPHDQLRILPYNRVVQDLNGLSASAFLARIGELYRVEASAQPIAPRARGEVGLYLENRWYRLQLQPGLVPEHDPIARLDVSLLHDHLIAPILQITDPRRDDRIDFVGGIRGLDGLQQRVDSGEMVAAFSLPATRMDDLLAVADAGEVMPPKSTWFEPKLADGLVSQLL